MIPRSPGGGHGNSLQYSCLKNPHGQGSLAGYSPWGCKESDTTDQLSTEHILISILKMLSNVLEELLWARWVVIKRHGKHDYQISNINSFISSVQKISQ